MKKLFRKRSMRLVLAATLAFGTGFALTGCQQQMAEEDGRQNKIPEEIDPGYYPPVKEMVVDLGNL